MRVWFLLCLLLIACADELPPSPPGPGKLNSITSGAITSALVVGQAPAWAAVASGITVSPSKSSIGQTTEISVEGFDIVHNKAYYYTAKTKAWKEFSLKGNVEGSRGSWVSGRSRGVIVITPDFEPGKVYLIVYACNRKAGGWSCNNKQWMLEEFSVVEDGSLDYFNSPSASSTPTSSAPGSASSSGAPPFQPGGLGGASSTAAASSTSSASTSSSTASATSSSSAAPTNSLALPARVPIGDMIINSEISPYKVLGTLIVPDTFGKVNVLRYDAKYGAGNEVLVYVFDFTSAELLQKGLQDLSHALQNGIRPHGSQKIGVFGDDRAHTIAFWTNGKRLVYIDTFAPEGSKPIIDAYLQKYPSELK